AMGAPGAGAVGDGVGTLGVAGGMTIGLRAPGFGAVGLAELASEFTAGAGPGPSGDGPAFILAFGSSGLGGGAAVFVLFFGSSGLGGGAAVFVLVFGSGGLGGGGAVLVVGFGGGGGGGGGAVVVVGCRGVRIGLRIERTGRWGRRVRIGLRIQRIRRRGQCIGGAQGAGRRRDRVVVWRQRIDRGRVRTLRVGVPCVHLSAKMVDDGI